MTEPDHHRRLERMYDGAPINQFYLPKMVVEEGRATVVQQVRPDLCHAAGAVHGSVYFKLMDDAAFFAVSSLIDDVFVLTTSFQTYFTRPVSDGTMTCVASVVSRSRRLYIADASITNADGKEIGRGSGSFMPSRIALDDKLGYK